MVYWLGKSSLFLPENVRRLVTENYSPNDIGDDVSYLTEAHVKYAFLYLDSNVDETLFIRSVRICKNLGRALVVVHHTGTPDSFIDDNMVFAHIPVDAKNVTKAFASLDVKLRAYGLNTVSDAPSRRTVDTEADQPLDNMSDKEQLVSKMLTYIDDNLVKNLKEKDVAEHCNLSVTYFSKTFHRHLGVNFRDYVINKKLSLAKDLLKQDMRCQVSVVAYQCGFNDVSYFSRMFKKRVGMSPGTYRNFGGKIEVPIGKSKQP
ncbi:helix-turn-helix domain-containing protein [Vibrio sp. 10N]|uniref:helix-turn-helix domain-containing protein n=1 Tax=Vibrio sp. 10N TaxID=3058938 RepID=UPI002813EB80|nr:AraC family transcriptional regulator [Vibrio sp. 10N]